MIAIVIPYFKLTFFQDTLESLSKQIDRRFRVYIGNDASPENPEELLKQYRGKLDFVYKSFDENLGGTSLTKHWERCIEMIEAEKWFMILGDDDTLEENVVKQFYDHCENFSSRSNVIRYATQLINENGSDISEVFLQPQYENAIQSYFRKLTGENRSSLSEYIFLRSQFDKFGFKNYPVAWCSDDRAVIDFSAEKPIFSINEARVFVRKSNVHISSDKKYNLEMHKAQIQNLRGVILDYGSKMEKEQKQFLVQSFENQVLSFPKINIADYFYVIVFFVKFMNRKSNILLYKSIFCKSLRY